MLGNIYYFRTICSIGGIETFFHELCKKYCKDYELVIYYDEADQTQLNRLRKVARCVQREAGKKVFCKKAFFNYNTDMIDDVIAEEYILVIHGNYIDMEISKPPQHPKITKYMAVSKDSAEAFTRLTGHECGYVYNPLSVTNDTDVMLVMASRLNDRVKGGALTEKLVPALDKWSRKLGINYTMLIFTNDYKNNISSPNVVILSPNIYIRPFLKSADWVLQLSQAEGYCYTINEALMYGTKCVITPLGIYDELGINSKMALYLDLSGDNVDDVAKDILHNKPRAFTYIPPKDEWWKLLSTYKEEYGIDMANNVKIKGIQYPDYYDTVEERNIGYGEEYYTSKERAKIIVGCGFAEYVDTAKEDTLKNEETEKDTIENHTSAKQRTKKVNGKKGTR